MAVGGVLLVLLQEVSLSEQDVSAACQYLDSGASYCEANGAVYAQSLFLLSRGMVCRLDCFLLLPAPLPYIARLQVHSSRGDKSNYGDKGGTPPNMMFPPPLSPPTSTSEILQSRRPYLK